MRRILPALIVPLALSGCFAYHDEAPPQRTTIVVPSGSTVTCSNGLAPPC